MTNLVIQADRRKRRASTPVDPNWQPLGLVVRRLMRRHGLPRATAIAVAESAGHCIEVRA